MRLLFMYGYEEVDEEEFNQYNLNAVDEHGDKDMNGENEEGDDDCVTTNGSGGDRGETRVMKRGMVYLPDGPVKSMIIFCQTLVGISDVSDAN